MGAAEGAVVGFEIHTSRGAALLVAAGGTDLPVGIDPILISVLECLQKIIYHIGHPP